MTESQKLLADYVTDHSETAFRELVARYLDLVFSTALRLVDGDVHRAQDVTQTVFLDLARQAPRLSSDTMLGGWLHRDTCFVAAKLMRGERRRQIREMQAAELITANRDDNDLAQIAPVLDQAINELADADRKAILLRFYERLDLQAVGAALGSSENAAQKRVSRALEELRSRLKHHGVSLSATLLATTLASEAASAAPVGLVATISNSAIASVAGTGMTFTLLKSVAMTKLKLGIVGVLILAGVATPLVVRHQAQGRLREKDTALLVQADRIAQLESENNRLSNLVAQAKDSSALSSTQARELLRLRSEVGMLRQQTNALERLRRQHQELLAQGAEQTGTNQVSAEDRFILRQTHAVDAMGTLLRAVMNYATNHNGQYPVNLEQLANSGALQTSNFAGNLSLADFECGKAGAVDRQGNQVLLRLRAPIQKPGGGSLIVVGSIGTDGVPHTTSWNVSP
ncbi:MAG TPA: sigma-70 family RNA polymerase sigma factor [Clostridia bacterium]|nr:sigma-70 family RNA polymerase sigma factor [Clostridia bacterium]